MYAVEFEAPIENGIVHIPKQYQELQQNTKAKFVVIYNDNVDNNIIKKDSDSVKSQLEEFRRLRNKSNNKIMATMDLITNIDAEMIDDGLF
jgi:CRISPR/Cas system endoribonuclease Cas6 (RAMP superfamily)